jgi:3,4-dihydroxy 2-butanone 4-phosphate synthase/GTP cyclohydrolase II
MSLTFSPPARIHTVNGLMNLVAYREEGSLRQHAILWSGDPANERVPLIRLQSACVTGTAFGSDICDCAAQLSLAFGLIVSESGIIVYRDEEGRGHGLLEKASGIAAMNAGADTYSAYADRGLVPDIRTYGDVRDALRRVGVAGRIRLLTNNPWKIRALIDQGFDVERVPLEVEPTPLTRDYLLTKKHRLGHLLSTV